MKRLIQFREGVIGGYEKERIEKILPTISNAFTQRKQYFEYYFEELWVELSLEDLEKLSTDFNIELGEFDLTIKL
tara:strand:- start:3261 stop:3485 length:225 start_codon:yes stop_codon:yes gene_type:complete